MFFRSRQYNNWSKKDGVDPIEHPETDNESNWNTWKGLRDSYYANNLDLWTVVFDLAFFNLLGLGYGIYKQQREYDRIRSELISNNLTRGKKSLQDIINANEEIEALCRERCKGCKGAPPYP